MAQSMGLHRETKGELERQTGGDHVQVRRRVWGGCIIADRWIAAGVRHLSLLINRKDGVDSFFFVGEC
jgi:hypothetical protein